MTKWEVIANVDDEDVYFVPDNNFGIPGLDFNQLENAEYPLAEIFNHLWPGDPIEQLRKLNAEYACRYNTKQYYTPITLKEYLEKSKLFKISYSLPSVSIVNKSIFEGAL